MSRVCLFRQAGGDLVMRTAQQNAYSELVFAHAPRLLGQLDREPHSASYGSFDREHWGWKFADFPIGMLQTGLLPLAILWRAALPGNPHHNRARIHCWIEGALRATMARQLPNGAFDSVGPNTQDHGTTLATAYALTETGRLLGTALAPDLRECLPQVTRRACDFAGRSHENYAFISNHHALFALAWWNASELLGESQFRQSAGDVLKGILRHQSVEGWYEEYGGCDPGYESLGIHYLALYWQRTGDRELLESLRRSVRFFWHFVHPDGSIGGVYGSRHTSLYFPGGFEILAGEIPEAAAVAEFMRGRLHLGNVVTPATTDAHNLAPLMSSYLTAAMAYAPRATAPPPLPCQTMQGVHHFSDSGLTVVATPAYYAVASARKGGVCRIFDRRTHTIAYEDAGYLVQSGSRRWASQMLGRGHSTARTDSCALACEAQFAAYEQPMPTPLRFVILRLLNLTLFRSVTLGALIRKWFIRLLITGRRLGPLRLRRRLTFDQHAVTIHDGIELDRPMAVDRVALPRALTGIHMGSAKYFHPSELVETPQAPVEYMAQALNRTGRAECRFTLKFLPEGGVALQSGDANPIQEVPETAGHTR